MVWETCVTCTESCFEMGHYIYSNSDTSYSVTSDFTPSLRPNCLFCSVVFNLHFVLSSYVKYPKDVVDRKYQIHFERINFKINS